MNARQHWEITEPCRVNGKNTAGDTVVLCLMTNTDDMLIAIEYVGEFVAQSETYP